METDNYTLIPTDKISPDALSSIIEEFILREGTDYGVVEKTLTDKKTRLLKQIESGDVQIVYDALTESVTLLTKLQLQKLKVKN